MYTPSSPLTAITGMVSEIEVMSHLGRHENIVNLVGIHTKSIRKGKIYLFLELCSLGSLTSTYAIKFQCQMRNLLLWSCEISNAMDFLSLEKVVHADLATRNVLLTLDKRAKVSDFGLSRRLNEYDINNKSIALAIETTREFNEKTDVWADLPYGGISWTPDFSAQLVRGLRLEEPTFNERGMYSIMLKCWNMDPSKRPTFSQLKSSLH
ncbi:Fibroblast growth factor receptor [Orchesella cincta]|uniref:Fibroblast growth factor receptor n=1 Tax=Orchesella cincta TaxID=48709 RepID=A0A1D2M404_ORCCI|nr:Fibroblast growth factor receptor [Orchesella cincta]